MQEDGEHLDSKRRRLDERKDNLTGGQTIQFIPVKFYSPCDGRRGPGGEDQEAGCGMCLEGSRELQLPCLP